MDPVSSQRTSHRSGRVRKGLRARTPLQIAAFAAVCSTAWIGWSYFGPNEANSHERNSHGRNSHSEAAVKQVAGGLGASTASAVAVDASLHADEAALTPNATVLEVIDGDTMEVDLNGRRATVRFLGIDTPEKTGGYLPAECGGDAATRRTAELLPPGTEVLLQRDNELFDRYDRLLAYVYRAADGLFVNLYLLLDGYAGTMHFEPNTHHRDVLDAAEADARAADRGIWSNCGGPDRMLAGNS